MKSNFLFIGAMFLFLAFTTSSCSDDDDGGSAGNAAAGTIVAKVDGVDFQSTEMLTTGNKVTSGPADAMTLQGTDNSGKGFNFLINGYDGVGTYTFGDGNAVQVISVIGNYIEANASDPTNSQTWTAPYDNDSVRGEIQFSTDDGENVQGTFSFTCKNPNDGSIKDITEGSFNVNYTTF
jgi:hypothetical protein